MYKEVLQDPFPPMNVAYGSWYVSQQRVHYQAFLNQGNSVLDIKPLMIVTN